MWGVICDTRLTHGFSVRTSPARYKITNDYRKSTYLQLNKVPFNKVFHLKTDGYLIISIPFDLSVRTHQYRKLCWYKNYTYNQSLSVHIQTIHIYAVLKGKKVNSPFSAKQPATHFLLMNLQSLDTLNMGICYWQPLSDKALWPDSTPGVTEKASYHF